MGENEYGDSSHLSIFTSLRHLMMLLKCTFFLQGFGGGGGGQGLCHIFFSSSDISPNFPYGVGASFYIANLSDKQASKQKKKK